MKIRAKDIIIFCFVIFTASSCLQVKKIDLKEKSSNEMKYTPMSIEKKKPICEIPNLKLPQEFTVFAAGAPSGRRIGFQIDQSGMNSTQIDVTVNYIKKPVILMLGSYDPTIWNIQWTLGTRVC